MNPKAQTNITIIFWTLIFLILYIMFFAGQLAYWGHAAALAGGYSGIEAFFYDNINIFIIMITLIFILAIGLIGGGNN